MYSLFLIRNGQQTQRVIMSDSGASKVGVPPPLVTGIAAFLEVWLLDRSIIQDTNLISYTR